MFFRERCIEISLLRKRDIRFTNYWLEAWKQYAPHFRAIVFQGKLPGDSSNNAYFISIPFADDEPYFILTELPLGSAQARAQSRRIFRHIRAILRWARVEHRAKDAARAIKSWFSLSPVQLEELVRGVELRCGLLSDRD
jgi:hypothetical protein